MFGISRAKPKPTLLCLLVASIWFTRPGLAQDVDSCVDVPDVIYYGGNVITMVPAQPTVQAIAVKGGTILAAGSDADILSLVATGCPTATANLNGLTIVPGFNDSHAHWFSWPEHICSVTEETTYPPLEEIMPMLSAQGWTSFSELNFGRPDFAPEHFENAMALDARDELTVRVNGYWGTYDDPSMIDVLAEAGRSPDSAYSDRIRAPGVKIYVDNPFGDHDILTQEQVDALVETAHAEGWQVAAHAVNQSAVEKILSAYENVLGSGSNAERRHRIEHAVKVSDDQLDRIKMRGIIASFQLLGPPDWPAQDDFGDRFLASNPEWVLRWSDFIEAEPAGARNTGSSDSPFNDSVCDPSPFRLIYQAVTRDGYVDRTPADWELAQRLSIEESLKLLTIDGAYATFDEDRKGSLEPGKWADFVILSADPISVSSPSELLDISVLMTAVGGRVEYCSTETDAELCSPSVSFAVEAGTVRASAYLVDQTPDLAFDGDDGTNWGAGDGPPQWIEITLDEPVRIGGVDLVTEQFPDGRTVHEIWVEPDDGSGRLERIHRFGGNTTTGQTLSFDSDPEAPPLRRIRVVTTTSPSWVSWREITLRPYSGTSVVDRDLPSATEVRIEQYPNPFADRVTISLTLNDLLGRSEDGEVVIYDVFGRIVRSFTIRGGSSGKLEIEWNGTDTGGAPVSNGLYVYRIALSDRRFEGKLILAR